jgi:CRISPR-associated protein Cmr2
MKTHIAITIGPIYETMSNVRHTREVWAASYLFSYISKCLIIKIIDQKHDLNFEVDFEKQIKTHVDSFILPNINSATIFANNNNVGLFPDQIIFKAELFPDYSKENFDTKIIDPVLHHIASEIGIANAQIKNMGEDVTNEESVFEFLKNYIRIRHGAFQFEADETNKNVIQYISPFINTFELEPHFVDKYKHNPLAVFFKNINFKEDNKHTPVFIEKHYDKIDVNGKKRFESVVEIATRELKMKNKNEAKYMELTKVMLRNSNLQAFGTEEEKKKHKDTDGDFIQALKNAFGDDFKTYHNYICIVKADGDKIGATLREINANQVEILSDNLLKWGLDSKEIIEQYDGVPIYIGGDDLLFFSPVRNGDHTIIDILSKIKENFENLDWKGFETMPSVSFGLSITYYKSPMSLAIETAESLLKIAKNDTAKGEKGGKVALKLLKHSGSSFSFVLKLDDSIPSKKSFDELLLKMSKVGKEASFLNGVGYKLRDNQALLECIAHDPQRIKNLFQNVFDEKTDSPDEKDKYLATLRAALHQSLTTYKEPEKQQSGLTKGTEMAMEDTFSTIRVAKFFNGLEEIKK